MHIDRRFTKADTDVFESVAWTTRTSRISNLDGSTVFEMNDAEVPASWSQLATDIMVSKYFRKAGVPQMDEKGEPQRDEHGAVITGPERSARQVIGRLAGCWRDWGQRHGYFDGESDAQAFHDEIAYMLLTQMAAPNSPQWFNTGLNWAYGITGPAQGHWVTDAHSGETRLAEDAYSHPQPHACFIQSVEDDLVNPGGIMDLWVREARLFKYGSGTGTNFSKLRGEDEPLSGGGRSSGLMSWLKIGDRAAGAIKSGGTTRRAAKMVCLDLDHPDVEAFINWKVREELKVAAMVEGMRHLPDAHARVAGQVALQLDYDFNGEAYYTVSGQNSNNSLRITNDFFRCVDEDAPWELVRRTDGAVARKLPAVGLWDQVCYAAWRCADPGVQFDTTINQWHTCPASGRINASNPCSEYMFLDNTACNLASLNLLEFFDRQRRHFDVDAFEHAVRLWTIVLEISVLMAAFPSRPIARLSYEYRTLGLGHANIGAMLMQAGIPYDSDRALAICGAITAVLTGRTYATSAEMAARLGPFAGYYRNREQMLRVIANHRRAAYGVSREPEEAARDALGDYEELDIRPVAVDAAHLESPGDADPHGHLANGAELGRRARAAWDDALDLGRRHGFRNAQTTVIAPTGTIGLLMDCDTTGVEPDFALVKFKKLAGGGYFKIANQSLKPALQSLGYDGRQIKEILTYVMGTLSLDTPLAPADGAGAGQTVTTFAQYLRERGLNDEDLRKVTEALPTVFELRHAFNTWALGKEAIERLGLSEQATHADFDLLSALGLSRAQVEALELAICGTQTVEGAPHLKDEHLAVFDCAGRCGPRGRRFIPVEGHIRMMAAAQPFISGAISKTINLPAQATVEDIKQAYRMSWELGLKANALYRDGCKLSQPLSAGAGDLDEESEEEEDVEAAREEVGDAVADLADCVANRDADPQQVERVIERVIERPMRRRLPITHRSITHKFNVAGHEGYLIVGLYENGTPGELFITMAKEGSTIGGLMDSLGIAISVALQYGVPIDSLVSKFTHQRFEPAGMTHNKEIPFAKSLIDYIFRWLGMEFIPGYRAANAPDRGPSADPPAAQASSGARRKAQAVISGNDNDNNNGTADGVATDRAREGDEHRGNGHGRREPVTTRPGSERARHVERAEEVETGRAESGYPLTTAMKELQADAPACDVCGTITVRNGTCYKCLNCGNSMGCS